MTAFKDYAIGDNLAPLAGALDLDMLEDVDALAEWLDDPAFNDEWGAGDPCTREDAMFAYGYVRGIADAVRMTAGNVYRAWRAEVVVLKPEVEPDTDFYVGREPGGTLVTLWLNTEAARRWVSDHLPDDAPRSGDTIILIEARYFPPILEGITNDGLVCK